MSADVALPENDIEQAEADGQLQTRAHSSRRRRTASVWLGRLALIVIILGGWQLATNAGIIDKFFYGQPTGIWKSLIHLFRLRYRLRVDLGEPVGDDQGSPLWVRGRHGCRNPFRPVARPEPLGLRCVIAVHQGAQCSPSDHPGLDLCGRVRAGH